MTVAELIAQLQKLPQDAQVYRYVCDGCLECNPEGIEHYEKVYEATYANIPVQGYRRPFENAVYL